MTRENGKALADALGEAAYAAEFFRWFAEEAVRVAGDFRPSRPATSASSYARSRSASRC